MDNRYFDTHTHYNDRRFDEDLPEVLRKVLAAGVLRDTIIGYDLESSKKAIRLAEAQQQMENEPLHYVAVGIHPLYTGEKDTDESDLMALEILAEDPAVVAIGEIGLDYHQKTPEISPDKEGQQWFFRKQLRIARRAGLPVVIHSRDAMQDTLQILEEEKAFEVGGVLHCYSGSPEMAEIFVRMGFLLGIGGMVTRPNAKKLRETVQRISLDNLVLETDCPYLPPESLPRHARNDSAALPEIAAAVAELKGCSIEEVCRVTWENACRLFCQGKD